MNHVWYEAIHFAIGTIIPDFFYISLCLNSEFSRWTLGLAQSYTTSDKKACLSLYLLFGSQQTAKECENTLDMSWFLWMCISHFLQSVPQDFPTRFHALWEAAGNHLPLHPFVIPQIFLISALVSLQAEVLIQFVSPQEEAILCARSFLFHFFFFGAYFVP